VIVIGASSGLGSRFARAVGAAGATVVVAARRRARLDALVDDLRLDGADAVAMECDVTVDSEVESLIAAGIERSAPLPGLRGLELRHWPHAGRRWRLDRALIWVERVGGLVCYGCRRRLTP
jgi:NAD(P)-dependent dehydrogenase (short-subunit alcohol dehydrogenase family)